MARGPANGVFGVRGQEAAREHGVDLVTGHVPDVRPADVQAADHGVVRVVADYGQAASGRLGDQRSPT
jgi:hypothetical protein